jgi:hypothetical protein
MTEIQDTLRNRHWIVQAREMKQVSPTFHELFYPPLDIDPMNISVA